MTCHGHSSDRHSPRIDNRGTYSSGAHRSFISGYHIALTTDLVQIIEQRFTGNQFPGSEMKVPHFFQQLVQFIFG